MHAEPHKRRNGDYMSQDRLDFSDFFSFWKLINKHYSCGTVSLGAKKTQCKDAKYNPNIYNDMLLLRSAVGAPSTMFSISFR